MQVKIGDICTSFCTGGTPKSTIEAYYECGDIPWLNTREITFKKIAKTEKFITQRGFENSSAKWIEPNSVIVAMYGATAGKAAINTVPLTTNQACCNITVNPAIADYRYIYYWFCDNYQRISRLANGGAQQNLSASIIKAFEIELPSMENQNHIADILWSIDDKIELNSRINDYLAA